VQLLLKLSAAGNGLNSCIEERSAERLRCKAVITDYYCDSISIRPPFDSHSTAVPPRYSTKNLLAYSYAKNRNSHWSLACKTLYPSYAHCRLHAI